MTVSPGTALRPSPAGVLLREWRERRRLSQLDLAHLAGTSPPAPVVRRDRPVAAEPGDGAAARRDVGGAARRAQPDPAGRRARPGVRRRPTRRRRDALLREAESYPARPADAEPPPGATFALPLELEVAGRRLRLSSTVATFGTALDVAASELAIETFLPADEATRAWLSAAG